MLSRKPAKQTCGSRLGLVCVNRTAARQKIKTAGFADAVIHKNSLNAAGNSEEVVHLWFTQWKTTTMVKFVQDEIPMALPPKRMSLPYPSLCPIRGTERPDCNAGGN